MGPLRILPESPTVRMHVILPAAPIVPANRKCDKLRLAMIRLLRLAALSTVPSFWHGSAPLQAACAVALSLPDEYYKNLQRDYAARRDKIVCILNAANFYPAARRISLCDGGL